MHSCAFTGHRKIEEGHKGRIDELLRRAIAFAYEGGCRLFLTGGALGFDTLAAKEILRFRMTHPDIALKVILPCKNQFESWTPSQVNMYEYTLANADEVEYISDVYTDGCMRERNRRLVDQADMLIAYVSRSHSGSGQTVRMASNDGKVIFNLYPSLE